MATYVRKASICFNYCSRTTVFKNINYRSSLVNFITKVRDSSFTKVCITSKSAVETIVLADFEDLKIDKFQVFPTSREIINKSREKLTRESKQIVRHRVSPLLLQLSRCFSKT